MAGRQVARDSARKAAAATRARLRAGRAQQERVMARLAENVMVLLATRDAEVDRCELAAGQALDQLVVEFGLTTSEASTWCGDLGVREVSRLRRRADAGDHASKQAAS